MNYVRSNTKRLHLNKGRLPRVPFCKGPQPSNLKGMDTVCCANCNIIRMFYYDYHGMLIDDDIQLFYMTKLIENYKAVLDVISVSSCDTPVIHYIPEKSFLERKFIVNALIEQTELMQKHNMIDLGITSENIDRFLITDISGTPYLMPSPEITIVKKFGGDEGIVINDGVITVTDMILAKQSGKWIGLLNFYTALDFLLNRKNTRRIFNNLSND